MKNIPSGSELPSADEWIRLALAYEANSAAYAAALTEAAGGLVQREQDYVLTIFPFPHSISGVFLPRFETENCRQRIEAILEIARLYRRRILFRIGPCPQPADLAQRLVQLGVGKSIIHKYMAMKLDPDAPILAKAGNTPESAGLQIYPLEDYTVLLRRPHPRLGLINTPKKRCLLRAFQKLAEQRPRCHWTFVAELDGRFVGAVGVYLHQNSVSGYDLLVLKEDRRMGIGSAMLRCIASFAFERGATLAVLASSGQGSRFYPRLGISHVGGYPIFRYDPKRA